MKTKSLLNIVAVVALCATISTCYFYYDYNRKEGISPVLVWGSAPIMIFIVVTSVLQLRRGLKPKRPYKGK